MALETKKNLVGKMVPNSVPKSQQKEKEREGNVWKKKLFGYLEGFKKSFAALEGGKERKKSGLGGLLKMFGGGLKGLMGKVLGMLGLTGIFAGLAGMGAAMLPVAIIIWGITAAFNVIQDWVEGFKEDGIKGAIAKALGGGAEGGIWNSVVQASKWGGIGALAGLATFGPIGALVGGLLGIAFGALFGWLGSDKINAWLTKVSTGITDAWNKVKETFGVPTLYTEAEYNAFKIEKTALEARLKEIKGRGGLLETIGDEIATLEAIASRRELTSQEATRYQELLLAEQALLAEVQANVATQAKIDKIMAQRTQAELNAMKAKAQQSFDDIKADWQSAQLAIDLLEGEMGMLRLAGKLTPEMRANFEKQIEIHRSNQKELADEMAAQGTIVKQTAEEAHAERVRLANEAKGWDKAFKKTGLFFSDLWSGKMFEGWLPEWMTKPLDEIVPNWMTEPLPTFFTWTLPNAFWNFWKGQDSEGNPLFSMPKWMTDDIDFGGVWDTIKTGFSNFWQGKDSEGDPLFNMPKWMTDDIDFGGIWATVSKTFTNFWKGKKADDTPLFGMPKWMTDDIDFGGVWDTIKTGFSNFWQGKDSKGDPLFNLPEWMTKPISELRPEWTDFVPDSMENFFKGKDKDGNSWIPKWITDPKGAVDAVIAGAAALVPESVKMFFQGKKKDGSSWIPDWITDPKGAADKVMAGAAALPESIKMFFQGKKKDGTSFLPEWLTTEITLPTITLPKWLTELKLPAWMTKEITLPEIVLPKWMTEPITLPTWMTNFTLPEWMTTKIALPTWEDMKAIIPWWLGGTKGKKEDLISDTAPVTKKMDWGIMPALPQIDLNLPDWMTEKDYFKFEWPEITIQDLTEGVKNLIRGLLPDPVEDPWMYQLIPQKIYDWLGVSTEVREAQAAANEAPSLFVWLARYTFAKF